MKNPWQNRDTMRARLRLSLPLRGWQCVDDAANHTVDVADVARDLMRERDEAIQAARAEWLDEWIELATTAAGGLRSGRPIDGLLAAMLMDRKALGDTAEAPE